LSPLLGTTGWPGSRRLPPPMQVLRVSRGRRDGGRPFVRVGGTIRVWDDRRTSRRPRARRVRVVGLCNARGESRLFPSSSHILKGLEGWRVRTRRIRNDRRIVPPLPTCRRTRHGGDLGAEAV